MWYAPVYLGKTWITDVQGNTEGDAINRAKNYCQNYQKTNGIVLQVKTNKVYQK